MSRFWNEFVAALGDLVPGGVLILGLLLFMVTSVVAVLWYYWPAWLPWRWRLGGRAEGGSSKPSSGSRSRLPRPRWPRLRWRWRIPRLRWRWRRRYGPAPRTVVESPDRLPELPAAVLALTADDLAAAGRYAEAVRERLRAIVRELIERDMLAYRPGWTVTELAQAAGRVWPAASAPLNAASEVFSQIWYGMRPATRDDDMAMRGYAEQVRAALDTSAVAASGGRAR